MTDLAVAATRFEAMRAEWQTITRRPAIDVDRFKTVKAEADDLVDRGLWTSGPSDMLSVMGRQRDELIHSRLIAWLLVPTNRHGLGRRVLTAFLDHIWPGEALLRTGPVIADLEVTGSGPDETGRLREARADIVLSGETLTVVIENKVGAGEQPDQCERLYWAWASEPGETRWVFLTPTGRSPLTATSQRAQSVWRAMSYRELRDIISRVIEDAQLDASIGRATAVQYLSSLNGTYRR